MTKIIITSVIILCLIIAGIFFLVTENRNQELIPSEDLDIESERYSLDTSDKNELRIVDEIKFVEPINEFEDRIIKKPFGIYITPGNSPISPERFRGYHTGVDVEYDDINEEVPVRSIADGEVILSKYINGYGGFIAIKHFIDRETILSLYGHMDPISLVRLSKKVSINEIIGYLGNDKSEETDGERKHLHFGIIKGDEIDVRGYVQSEIDLNKWHDPQEYLK